MLYLGYLLPVFLFRLHLACWWLMVEVDVISIILQWCLTVPRIVLVNEDLY